MSDDDNHAAELPLDAWHRAHGARMVPFAGYAMPIQYDGIVAEHVWTRAHAGLFDVSHMGQLVVSGEGAVEALEAILPSDIVNLGLAKVRYSLLLDADGGVLDDLMVTRRADDFYLVVNGSTKHDDIAHLREHLPDAITLNHAEDRALLAVQGPEAVAAVARVVPGVDALYFMESGVFGDLWISRSGYTGEDGVEISVPVEDAAALADALLAQPEIKPIGLGARDSLRLEAGLPLYGHDLSPERSIVEADLIFAVQKRRRLDGGFIGEARVLGELAQGSAERRVGLAIAGRLPAREGATVHVGDAQIGTVTSGGFSPTLQAPIAMAYVTRDHASVGTALEIDVRGRRLPATVVPLPFVPHRYHRRGAA